MKVTTPEKCVITAVATIIATLVVTRVSSWRLTTVWVR